MKVLIKKCAAAVFAVILFALAGCKSLPLRASAPVEDEHLHQFSSSIRPATCTASSYAVYTCECGVSYSYPSGEPLPHTYGEWHTETDALCETDGVQSRKCKVCGHTETKAVPATGHSFGGWNVVTPATPAADGLKRRVCSACGLVEDSIMPATGSLGMEIDGGAVLEIGICTDSELYIPTTADKADVTSIADRAFVNCTALTSVTVSKNVVSIGYRAFYNCSSLVSVTVPASVRSIGPEAFGSCLSLKYIYFYGTKDKFDELFADAKLPPAVTVVYKQ